MANQVANWSPFRELDSFRRSLDRMFDDFLGGWNPMETFRGASSNISPAVESFVDGENLVVRADLPGIDPKDVDVTVANDTLTIYGRREETNEEKQRDYMHREVSYGSFTRTMALPKGIEADQIKASYRNGVLELRMPLPKQMSPRKVQVAIENGSGNGGGRLESSGGTEKGAGERSASSERSSGEKSTSEKSSGHRSVGGSDRQ
jgi:HSP20 family protein